MKIDPTDFLDKNGNFYVEKADAFIHFSLVELAGPNHLKKLDEPVYYYDEGALFSVRMKDVRPTCRLAAKLLTPY